ncbi:UNVERIFIED_CONTAM: hypothetical protein Sindi_0966400 [Sesamum indicum]
MLWFLGRPRNSLRSLVPWLKRSIATWLRLFVSCDGCPIFLLALGHIIAQLVRRLYAVLAPPKVRVFMWKMCMEALLTLEELASRVESLLREGLCILWEINCLRIFAMASAEYSGSMGNDATSRGGFDQEFMHLHSSDHPGMVMVSALLTGNNYFAWSRAVRRALTAKMKLDFINDTAIRPHTNTDEFKRWNRIDSMVTTWVLNSVTKELAESFMYVTSSRELWLELEARFGDSNSMMVYQLQREIGQVTQGNLSITEYYTQLKRLWDELSCLAPSPKCVYAGCTCGINKAMADMSASNLLIQFLVGLSMVYDQARSQILFVGSVTFSYQSIFDAHSNRKANANEHQQHRHK